jgi:hypothetical protein
VDGTSLRRIARHLDIHYRTVFLWVKAPCCPTARSTPPAAVKEAEMDELFTFIGEKKPNLRHHHCRSDHALLPQLSSGLAPSRRRWMRGSSPCAITVTPLAPPEALKPGPTPFGRSRERRVASLSSPSLEPFFALFGSLKGSPEALYLLFQSASAAQAALSQLLSLWISICLAQDLFLPFAILFYQINRIPLSNCGNNLTLEVIRQQRLLISP